MSHSGAYLHNLPFCGHHQRSVLGPARVRQATARGAPGDAGAGLTRRSGHVRARNHECCRLTTRSPPRASSRCSSRRSTGSAKSITVPPSSRDGEHRAEIAAIGANLGAVVRQHPGGARMLRPAAGPGALGVLQPRLSDSTHSLLALEGDTPLTGRRVSAPPLAVTPGSGGACWPADSTSARVTVPFGPVGRTASISTPSVLASLRTGGLASARWRVSGTSALGAVNPAGTVNALWADGVSSGGASRLRRRTDPPARGP